MDEAFYKWRIENDGVLEGKWEYAESAYKAGREAGMREAAAFLNDAGRVDRALENWKPGEMKAPYLADAILSAIGDET